MRAMWKGSVSFGLVSIPIQLYAATENKAVSLHQVHEKDGARVQYKRYCSVENVEIPYGEIAKGFELDDGRMVILTNADLADLPLSTSRVIDVLEFVDLEAIDPIYFDRSYYLEPQQAAVKPYVLLRDALHKSGHVAVAKVALRQREALAVLRVHADVLVLTTMLWPDEVRTPDFGFLREDSPQVRPQELTMAGALIESLTEPVFEPDKFHDQYRAALDAVIETKIAGKQGAKTPKSAGSSEVADLISVLEASVSAAKKDREPATPRRATTTRKTADTATKTTTTTRKPATTRKSAAASRSTSKSTAETEPEPPARTRRRATGK
jgi:DNA end-binding protein Ku